MSPIRDSQGIAAEARRARAEAEDALHRDLNRLLARQNALEQARRRGKSGRAEVARLGEQVEELAARVRDRRAGLAAARSRLADAIVSFPGLERPRDLVEQLDDRLPFLLLPVRVETRFMSVDEAKELWVRIFPDDMAVHTHEEELTAEEIQAGRAYWREVWAAGQEEDPAEGERLRRGAWRALAGEYGGPRAAWVAARTEPESTDVASPDELSFPEFDPAEVKPESWSRAPRSNVMPDRFVVMTFAGDDLVHEVVGAPIPDPLILGPDPQALEPDLEQREGELAVGEDLSWVYDFEEAVRLGMAVRIPLAEPHASVGFDRVLVLGLRLSADAEEGVALLEGLLNGHHYSPDGISLLRQGTATNNTGREGSGFSSADRGAASSYEVETGDPLFDPTDGAAPRSDGQRLVEALGIAPEPLFHVQNADMRDFDEARSMNVALFPATLGYFMEEMIGLDAGMVRDTGSFFNRYVTGRGPLPALRVGTQPYGILVTSAFPRWSWSRENDGADFPFLDRLDGVLRRFDEEWGKLVSQVPHVGADADPFQNLLSMLGLHATSVERYRRHAVGREYIWNYQVFNISNRIAQTIQDWLAARARQLLNELGLDVEEPPKIFDLAFFQGQNLITDPFVEDVETAEDERWSETRELRAPYKIPELVELSNYIGWLRGSEIDAIKRQRFLDAAEETLPAPRALLYRLLRRALLLAYHDATVRLYVTEKVAEPRVARELELPNVRAERTVTRWELMEARARDVVPNVSDEDVPVVQLFQRPIGLARPEAAYLRELREALGSLEPLPTARLERLLAEHIDLCAYRLDAWQTAMFARRLERLRFPSGEESFDERATGIFLGAFGWLEHLRPGPEPIPVDLADVPVALQEPEKGPITESPESGGFIHGPSLNHAVTAAVLRNAYLTHADPDHPERMGVNLSSERVRTALALIEGIRGGQELGALLGYQFERGLHDRHDLPDAAALDQYVLGFRQQYPLVADKITQDAEGEQIETKEARNVFDGYALVEAAFLKDPPLGYPYDVADLPAAGSAAGTAIREEVERMAASLDAVADLALAEGVYQVAQGNYERGGAMMKALTEGANPPEPEIVRTPRSGAAVNHRVTLHFETGGPASSWPGPPTPRARAEPGLNRWLGGILGAPGGIRFIVEFTNPHSTDVGTTIADLGIQPIDLLFLIGDEVNVAEGNGSRDDTTALESRIAYLYRRKRRDVDGMTDIGDVSIRLMQRDPSWDPGDATVFEMLPLLRRLRDLVGGSRPAGADDYALPSESTTDPAVDPNPKRFDDGELKTRLDAIFQDFSDARDDLTAAITAAERVTATETEFETLRGALVALGDHGLSGAWPRDAVGTSPEAHQLLLDQAASVLDLATERRDRAQQLKELTDLTAEEQAELSVERKVERYREAARQILGAAFNLLPRFSPANPDELEAAVAFRDTPLPGGLTRYSNNPLIVDEWLQGAARVREPLSLLEDICSVNDAFARPELSLQPLQLPFREEDHWIAVEYPEVAVEDLDDPTAFRPEGDFLSVVQHIASGSFDPRTAQTALVVDEWSEVIPGRIETSGVAVHYDQPSSEPPQALLLAVTPEITGSWSWDDLVAILHDTLDRAKKRAVEPDQLDFTPLGHLLPAILTAVTTYPFATISTDLVYQSEIAFAQLAPSEGPSG